MGMFDFVKDAGKKLTGQDHEAREESNREKAHLLVQHVKALGFEVDSLGIDFYDGTATVKGIASSREVKEKVVLSIGNTQGVSKVNDLLRIATPVQRVAEVGIEEAGTDEPADPPETNFYTVQPGDSLSKIAKEFYGDPLKYTALFDANKEVIKNPDLIYPGQQIRIPKDL